MNESAKNSLNYIEYKTISMLPEEILEAYCDKMTIENVQKLYECVVERFKQLPENEMQVQLEQLGNFLQGMLDGKQNTLRRPHLKEKSVHVQDASLFANYAIAFQKNGNEEKAFEMFKKARDAGYPMYNSLVETHGIGKRIYGAKIDELMNRVERMYSNNYKEDALTIGKVRKYYRIPESEHIHGFFDYTVFGSGKEGVVVTSEGIYFKTSMSGMKCIKWYELFKYNLNYKNCIQLELKEDVSKTMEIYFQTFMDATIFLEVMEAVQKL